MIDFLRALSNILLLTGVGLLFVLLWGVGTLAVVAAVNRRALPVTEKIFWVALAVVLPVIGALIYLLAAPLERWLAAANVETSYPRLVTKTQLPGPSLPTASVTISPLPVGGALPAGWRARVVQGPLSGQTFALTRLPAWVGRGTDQVISLSGDQHVSRMHAELYKEGSTLRIRDLGSTHGTTLNGRVILDEIVRSGDKIGMGDTIMVIEYSE